MPGKPTAERKQPDRLNQVRTDLRRLKAELHSLEIDTFEIEDIDDLGQQAATVRVMCSTSFTSCCCFRPI